MFIGSKLRFTKLGLDLYIILWFSLGIYSSFIIYHIPGMFGVILKLIPSLEESSQAQSHAEYPLSLAGHICYGEYKINISHIHYVQNVLHLFLFLLFISQDYCIN